MEKLLLFQIIPEEPVLRIAQRLHIRTVSVPLADYGKSIGQLAGFPDGTANNGYDGAALDGSLLVLCELKERTMDKLLQQLRENGVSITYKAVLTPTNRNWNVIQLYAEMEREKQAIQQRLHSQQ